MPNSAYLHILLNHFPVIGTGFIFVLGLHSLISKNDKIKRFSMILLVLLSLFTIVIFVSGNNAKGIVKGMDGIVEENIDAHEDFAQKSFIVMETIGGLTLLFLIFNKFSKPIPSLYNFIFLLLLLVILGMMMYTAHLGGKIAHSGIMPT
jgi:hypothetical protein